MRFLIKINYGKGDLISNLPLINDTLVLKQSIRARSIQRSGQELYFGATYCDISECIHTLLL